MRHEDPFYVLGVPRDASSEEVKKRYLELVKKWHPDSHQQKDAKSLLEAETEFKRIQRAFSQIAGKERSPGNFPNYYAHTATATETARFSARQMAVYIVGVSCLSTAFVMWWSKMVTERERSKRAMEIALDKKYPTPSPDRSAADGATSADEGEKGTVSSQHTEQLRAWRSQYGEAAATRMMHQRKELTISTAMLEASKGAGQWGLAAAAASAMVKFAQGRGMLAGVKLPAVLTRTPSICFYISGMATAGFIVRGYQTVSPHGRLHRLQSVPGPDHSDKDGH